MHINSFKQTVGSLFEHSLKNTDQQMVSITYIYKKRFENHIINKCTIQSTYC